MTIAFAPAPAAGTRRRTNHSKAEFQLSHKCAWRMMRLFVVAMGKTENFKLADPVFVIGRSP